VPVAVENIVVVIRPLAVRAAFWMRVSAGVWISITVIAAVTETPRDERAHAVGAHFAEGNGGSASASVSS